MELRLGEKMTAAAFVLAVTAALAYPQSVRPPEKPRVTAPFYNIESEVRVEGVVENVRFEPRYEGTAAFLLLDLEERATKRKFLVEISPGWFFTQDVHRGERVNILGSLVSAGESDAVLIAREVLLQGEVIQVRDARGFPNWRGGPRQMGKRKRIG